jgi:DNA-binding response OmpR family regulator
MAKILAVDDEASILRLVATTLESRGHQVITASNGDEGILKAHSEQPDLVLLDVMMPRLDGREVRDRLKADDETKHIPIIFLTALGEFESQLDTMESGAEDYVTKPFSPSDLADRVAAVLDPSRTHELSKMREQEKNKLRAYVEIMHRKKEGEGS